MWLAYQRLVPTARISADGAADLQQALWNYDEALLRAVRSPAGTPDDALLAAMLGGVGGRSTFLSMAAAHNRDPESFARLARLALDTAPARLIIVAPPEALERAKGLLDYHGAALAAAVPHALPFPPPVTNARLPGPAFIELDNQLDGYQTALAGWRLDAPATQGGPKRAAHDASMLILQAWFEHDGGALNQSMVREARMFHALDVTIRERPDPILIIGGRASHTSLSKAHERLVAQAEFLATSGPTAAVLASAKKSALLGLELRWSSPARRVQLLSELSATGRISRAADAEKWLTETSAAVRGLSRSTFAKFGRYNLTEGRRSGVRVRPASTGERFNPEITDQLLDMFVRMLVDMRCPLSGGRADVRALLRDKYEMTTSRYARLTRAIAREPRLMHRLGDEARTRCSEFNRLRSILPPRKIPSLYEEVSCGPGLTPETKLARKRLRRILKRYGIDRSWVRPLVGMAREDTGLARELRRVDMQCGARKVSPAQGQSEP